MKRKSKTKRRKQTNRSLSLVRFGVELEVEFPHSKDSQKLIAKHRLISGWEIDFDGTLDNGAEYRPKNKNKLFWNEDCFDQIKEIIGLIKAHRGNIKGSTCGLHVHVDMKQFSNSEIVNIIKTFIKEQGKIYRQFRIIPSRKEYAQKIPIEVIKQLTIKRIQDLRRYQDINDYDSGYFTDRHYAVNILSLNKHGTMEFRLFNGSLKINQIKKAIKFAIQFCLKHAKG